MKKVFLLFAVFSACTATAQQKNMFDAEKYLQKKKGSDKNIKTWSLLPNPGIKQNPFIITAFPKAKLSHQLSNGNRVFLLPVDNMPCISPDMTRYRNMPNAHNDIRQFIFRQRGKGQMPNPAEPFILVYPN